MHKQNFYRPFALLAILLFAVMPAWSHPSHEHPGWWSALIHPLTGPDHLLAAFGIGVWACSRKRAFDKQTLFALSAVCTGTILLTLLFAALWLPLSSLEWLLAGSVLAIGMLVLSAARLPFWSGALLVGFFIACHIYAHIVEMPVLPNVYSAAAFAGGLTAAMLVLASVGMLTARRVERLLNSRGVTLIGGALVACGLYLLNTV